MKIVVHILFWLSLASFLLAIICRLFHIYIPLFSPWVLTRATWTGLLFLIAIILIWKK